MTTTIENGMTHSRQHYARGELVWLQQARQHFNELLTAPLVQYGPEIGSLLTDVQAEFLDDMRMDLMAQEIVNQLVIENDCDYRQGFREVIRESIEACDHYEQDGEYEPCLQQARQIEQEWRRDIMEEFYELLRQDAEDGGNRIRRSVNSKIPWQKQGF